MKITLNGLGKDASVMIRMTPAMKSQLQVIADKHTISDLIRAILERALQDGIQIDS